MLCFSARQKSTGWSNRLDSWVGLTLIWTVPPYTWFCLGCWEIGRTGWEAGQDGGKSLIRVNPTKLSNQMDHPVEVMLLFLLWLKFLLLIYLRWGWLRNCSALQGAPQLPHRRPALPVPDLRQGIPLGVGAEQAHEAPRRREGVQVFEVGQRTSGFNSPSLIFRHLISTKFVLSPSFYHSIFG